MADVVLVNSKFTKNVFKKTFKNITSVNPEILYPCLSLENYDMKCENDENSDVIICFLKKLKKLSSFKQKG